jgi:hypothetical protein
MTEASERIRHRAENRDMDSRDLHPGQTIRLLFTKPPSPEGCFIEAENEERRSVHAGDWRQREDGLWELAIRLPTE